MAEIDLEQEIYNKATTICRILDKGNDVEMRKSKGGIKVIEVVKKTIE